MSRCSLLLGTCTSITLTAASPSLGDCRILFSAVYATVGFKEASAKVYLPTVPITARILEVERFTTAQDRFNLSHHRSVNKVMHVHDSGRERPTSGSLSVCVCVCVSV